MIKTPGSFKASGRVLEGVNRITFSPGRPFKPPVVPEDFLAAGRLVVIPFDGAQIHGAAIIACSDKCHCSTEEIELVGLIIEPERRGAQKGHRARRRGPGP